MCIYPILNFADIRFQKLLSEVFRLKCRKDAQVELLLTIPSPEFQTIFREPAPELFSRLLER